MAAPKSLVNLSMNKENAITAAVLAGGKSLRFGSSKLDALFRGQRLLDRAVDTAGAVSAAIVIIGENAKPQSSRSVSVFSDIYKNKGPLGGIHAALSYSRNPVVAVLPADMPFLSVEIYTHLLSVFTNGKPLAAESDKGLEPLVSLWPVDFLPEVESCLKEGRLGIFKCWKKWKAQTADCTSSGAGFDQRIFININRQTDLDGL